MLGSDRARNHPALIDAATGLANQLQFDLVYDYLFLAGQRGLSFTVMVASADLDGSATNESLLALGQAIDQTTRSADLVSHLGGGRYVALLVGTNLQGARIVADRIEVTFETIAPETIAFGLAAFAPTVSGPRELLKSATAALLRAEGNGGGIEFG